MASSSSTNDVLPETSSVCVAEAKVEEPAKGGRRAPKAPKAPKVAAEPSSSPVVASDADRDVVADAARKTSMPAELAEVPGDASAAPEPPADQGLASKKRGRPSKASGGEEPSSADAQKPASKKAKAESEGGKAAKKPKVLQLDANGDIVDDRITPILNKKGLRDSLKASHPGMKIAPDFIKAFELKCHRVASESADRATASGRKTIQAVDA